MSGFIKVFKSWPTDRNNKRRRTRRCLIGWPKPTIHCSSSYFLPYGKVELFFIIFFPLHYLSELVNFYATLVINFRMRNTYRITYWVRKKPITQLLLNVILLTKHIIRNYKDTGFRAAKMQFGTYRSSRTIINVLKRKIQVIIIYKLSLIKLSNFKNLLNSK